jgi:hypothetical protein
MTKRYWNFLSLLSLPISICCLISLYEIDWYPWRFDSIHSHCHHDVNSFPFQFLIFSRIFLVARYRVHSKKLTSIRNLPIEVLDYGLRCISIVWLVSNWIESIRCPVLIYKCWIIIPHLCYFESLLILCYDIIKSWRAVNCFIILIFLYCLWN